MAAELFVDTSAWFAIVDRSVPEAGIVRSALKSAVQRRVRLVTTNLIVAESHALVLRRVGRVAALTFVRQVGRTPNIVVDSTPELEATAVDNWLERFDDQSFSFTDAVSFAVMRERRIREALTLDHHFSVAGFVMVPGSAR